MKYKTLTSTVPILSPSKDRHFGQTPEGWGLYETPDELLYFASLEGPGQGYILPVGFQQKAKLHALRKKFQGHEKVPSKSQCAETAQPIPEAPGLIGMLPSCDRLFGGGADIIGFVTQSQMPYFLHGEHCIVTDALPFRLAFSFMAKLPYAKLTTDASDPAHPKIFIEQSSLYLCFHLVHPGDAKDHYCEGCIHATPLLLQGEHEGRKLNLRMQP